MRQLYAYCKDLVTLLSHCEGSIVKFPSPVYVSHLQRGVPNQAIRRLYKGNFLTNKLNQVKICLPIKVAVCPFLPVG
jgi:hypothetical protein